MSMNIFAANQYTRLPHFQSADESFLFTLFIVFYGFEYPYGFFIRFHKLRFAWLECRGQQNLSLPFNEHLYIYNMYRVLPARILTTITLFFHAVNFINVQPTMKIIELNVDINDCICDLIRLKRM